MTEQEQREALAKWEGLSDQWFCPTCNDAVPPECVTYNETHDTRYGGCGGSVRHDCPAYDLNDMARVRGKMTVNQRLDYVHKMHDVVIDSPSSNPTIIMLKFINATAAQHREAALRALGLWKKDKP